MRKVDIVKKIAFSIVLGSIVFPTWLAAQTLQSHDQIHKLVQNFMKDQLQQATDIRFELAIDKLDPRLNLPQCSNPLKVYTTNAVNALSDNRVSVGVACEGTKPWNVYVPVGIKRFATVYIAAQHLQRGKALAKEDFEPVEFELTRLLGGYFLANSDITGMIATRPLRAGTVLTRHNIRKPDIVKKGEKIIIVANQAHFVVRMRGEALSDGQMGERIRVRNVSSKKTVEAIVVSPGIVEVML